ncbi:S-adenosyl-L-methionine-dependent methyltransferases superfamily protein [Actinidia rufa]|uniref:S-adenosyl-L-methionine-dependent methyltransferases superfamily protein n=1 Tax=Actinidia rufa TaxID=165716 RepID=A0A7J0EWT3_9ERIC|nr:S-adenosyl-L-methionine-dependent methyltransferases superfamily protein [Actinidia rufa]
MLGCCVVVLRKGDGSSSDLPLVDASTIAIGCWRGRTNVSVMRGLRERGWGSAMVLLRAQRALIDLTESGLELCAVRSERDSEMVRDERVLREPSSSHRSDFGGKRKSISNSDQIQSAQKWRLSIPPDLSRRDEAPAPNRIKIGRWTSLHAPPEVRRVRSTHPTRARGRRRVPSTRPRAPHAPTRALTRWNVSAMNWRKILPTTSLTFSIRKGKRERITPCGKPRMKDTEGDEQEDDWADQTMHWTREKNYSGRTNERVPESHRKRSKEEAREEVSRRRSQRRDKKNCPRNKAQDQSSEAATTAMMAVDESDVLLAASTDEESDWIFDSGIAYHLCRDKEWRNIQSFQGKQEKLQEKEDWKAIPTEGECPDRRAAVRHRSTVEQECKEMLWDTCGSLARHEKVQPVQDVHEEAQRRETESMHNDRRDVAETSLFRSRSVAVISPVVHTREERWSHDDLQSDVLCSAPRKGSAGSRNVILGDYREHTACCCVQRGLRERGWGSAMVLLRAQRALIDLTESGLELCAVRSERDSEMSLGTTRSTAKKCLKDCRYAWRTEMAVLLETEPFIVERREPNTSDGETKEDAETMELATVV